MADNTLDFENQIAEIEARYNELTEQTESNEVMTDNRLYAHLLGEKNQIEEVFRRIFDFRKVQAELEADSELLSLEEDAEAKQKLVLEINEFESKSSELKAKICELISERRFVGRERVKLEITFKEEFEQTSEFFAMIESYAKISGCSADVQDKTGGKFVADIEGPGVYQKFQIFSGQVKFVIRGKEFFATIAVLHDETEQPVFDENDVTMQTLKSSGAGGQHINKTESAVRLTHTPTGISVECQEERYQTANKIKAMQLLKQRVEENFVQKREKSIKNQRKMMQNALFSDTPSVVFDFDKNEFSVTKTKKQYRLRDVLSGKLEMVFGDISENGR